MGGEGIVEVEKWGDGVLLYTLRRGRMHLKLTNWGATITSLCLPDAQGGEVADIVLGFDNAKPYMDGTSPYFGCIVGRVANRIGGAKFSLQGHCYDLPANNGPNTLHGGFVGYDKVLWESREVNNPEGPSVQFTHHSFDGDQGFPGDLMVTVTYIISKDFEVRTEMEAVAETKATPVSLAQHTYWNLCGHNSGDILNHWLRIWASQITPVNDHQIPVGLLTPVHNTPFDFTEEAQIGSRIDKVPGGYDHNYVLDGELREQGLHLAARARDRSSGRVLELLTNAPGMQFYTGNFLDEVLGKGGYVYRKHAGFCLETQGFPNAINQPNFPSIVILPGQTYKHVMIYRFSFEEDRSNDAPPLS